MKFNTKFNDQEIDVMDTKTIAMSIDEDGMSIAMKTVTSDLYSNPIGSIVREVTSNATDSHNEAKVSDPVKLKLTYEESGVYVSIQDFGIGMNPQRVETIYGRYYSSTKRGTNGEKGGFGLGGKSPMAYADAFFVITIADKADDIAFTTESIDKLKLGLVDINAELEKGKDANQQYLEHLYSKFGDKEKLVDYIAFLENRLAKIEAIKEDRVEYHYNIFKGEKSPVIQELYFHGTTDHKGTEVKIPVRKDDISKFAYEIKRQLYYFNNVVFEGWDNQVEEDYTIYKGKNFLYRGEDFERRMHISLDDVAYQINYSNLPDVNEYDCDIPVAIILETGDIEVTPSRESVLYSDKTIKIITEKIKMVKEELREMYTKQSEDIVELEDYLIYLKKSTAVKIGDDQIDISSIAGNIVPKNFKYAKINVKNNSTLFEMAYNYHKVGITKRRNNSVSIDYSSIKGEERWNSRKLFRTGFTFPTPNNYKKAYIKKEIKDAHDGHIVLVKKQPKNYTEEEWNKVFAYLKIADYDNWDHKITKWHMEEKEGKSIVKKLIKDIHKLVEKYVSTYDFEAPEDFIEAIKASRRKKTRDGDTKLSIRDYGSYESACDIRLSSFKAYKGKIFYALKEDEDGYVAPLSYAKKAFEVIFPERKICKPYYGNSNGLLNKDERKKGIMFVRVRKNQMKHFENLPNAFHARDFYKVMVSRKRQDFVNYYKRRNLKNLLMNLPSLFKNPDAVKINENIAKAKQAIQDELNAMPTTINHDHFGYYGVDDSILRSNLNIKEESKEINTFKSRLSIKYLTDLATKNEDILTYIKVDESTPFTDKLVMLLDLALEI